MIDNIVSFEDLRLAKLDGTLFSRNCEEVTIAKHYREPGGTGQGILCAGRYIERIKTRAIITRYKRSLGIL